MTVKECYTQFGGNYEDTLRRLTNEALVSRFLLKFLDDKSYYALLDAITTQKAPEAFAAAHTLKGVTLNLGLTTLYEPTNTLTEALRNGWAENASDLLVPVTEAYNTTVAAIVSFKESLN